MFFFIDATFQNKFHHWPDSEVYDLLREWIHSTVRSGQTSATEGLGNEAVSFSMYVLHSGLVATNNIILHALWLFQKIIMATKEMLLHCIKVRKWSVNAHTMLCLWEIA